MVDVVAEFTLESDVTYTADIEVQTSIKKHNKLENRDLPDQHPISAITGLTEALASGVASVEAEAQARQEADSALQTAIDDEISRATGAENQLSSDITSESQRALQAESVLNTKIEDETARAEGVESALNLAITAEETARENADESLQDKIDEEKLRATTAEESLRESISNEVDRATNAEEAIADDLSDEVTRATNSESALETAINSEISAREQADTTLQNNITAEENRAKGIENGLRSDLTAETTRATGIENQLRTDLTTETTARQNADTGLQGQITTNANDIDNIEDKIPAEASSSNQLADKTYVDTADSNLQSQIDAISASSDVTDIVGTYAELQAYDTSTLTNDDIIKVLQDESRGGATTYYRWVVSGSSGSFVLIGSEGPYYTKSEADELFNEKQDEITSTNKLVSDLVDDSGQTNKFVTASEKSQISTNASNITSLQSGKADKATTLSGYGITDAYTKTEADSEFVPQTRTVNGKALSSNISLTASDVGADVSGSASTAETSAKNYADSLASNYATAAQGAKADTAVQPRDLATVATSGSYKDLSNMPTNDKFNWYGTCATAAATRNKVVTCTGFTLVEGVSIRVKFTEGQGYNGSCRLNVNGTGNITVYSKDDTASVRYCWNAGEVVGFTYNDTKWIMDDSAIASTTYYGVTKLSSSLTSTSTALAATPSTVNGAMQNIVTGYPVYSTTSGYAVGEKVRYSSAMYECNTAIAEGGESWNAEHWTQLPAVMTQLDGKINSDGGNSTQTISLTSGSGTTPLTIKSMSNSSYISFMGTNGWIASLGVTNNKKPSLYDGTSHTIAYTTDIPTVNNPTITITQGGVSKGSFTLNQATGDTIDIDAGGSQVYIDNKSITENSSNKIQAIGVINSRDNTTAIKTWTGTKVQHDSMASPDWTVATLIEELSHGITWNALAFDGNKFVAISVEGYVSTSTDGTIWTEPDDVVNLGYNQWYGLVYDGSKFVALGVEGYISTSVDGTTWTQATYVENLGSEHQWFGLVYDGSKFLAICYDGYISTSENGTTWTQATYVGNIGEGTWWGLAYGNNKFVAITSEGYVSTSTDGTTWTQATQNSNLGDNFWVRLIYDGSKFLALGYEGYISTSVDGTTWTQASQDSNLGNNNWTVLAKGSEKVVALSNSGYVSTRGLVDNNTLYNVVSDGIYLGTEKIAGNGGGSYTAGTGIDITNDVISVDGEQTNIIDTAEVDSVTIDEILSSITGYDSTKTQTLKNINGVFTWVDD